jgi:hypothetical protein
MADIESEPVADKKSERLADLPRNTQGINRDPHAMRLFKPATLSITVSLITELNFSSSRPPSASRPVFCLEEK